MCLMCYGVAEGIPMSGALNTCLYLRGSSSLFYFRCGAEENLYLAIQFASRRTTKYCSVNYYTLLKWNLMT